MTKIWKYFGHSTFNGIDMVDVLKVCNETLNIGFGTFYISSNVKHPQQWHVKEGNDQGNPPIVDMSLSKMIFHPPIINTIVKMIPKRVEILLKSSAKNLDPWKKESNP
jgi:hypothetical protein